MRAFLVLLFSLLLIGGPAAPTSAAPTGEVQVYGPSEVRIGDTYSLQVRLAGDDAGGYEVGLERQDGDTWTPVGEAVTDSSGTALFTLAPERTSGTRSYRATYGQDLSPVFAVAVKRRGASLTLTASPADPLKRRPYTLAATLSDGEPLADRRIRLEEFEDGAWRLVVNRLTDEGGVARFERRAQDGRQRYRAVWDGNDAYESAVETLEIGPQNHSVVVEAEVPDEVVDQSDVVLRYRVRTRDGRPIADARVSLEAKLEGRDQYKRDSTGRTDSRGRVAFRVQPRLTGLWRLRVQAGSYYTSFTSGPRKIKNVPLAAPVVLSGPAPRITLPPQPRAVTRGADVRISAIPDSVWASMQGRSWRPGCTPRSSLRYIRVNYISFDGYARQGQLVVAASAAGKYREALEAMYDRRIPIRHMYLVDRFGYSSKLRGANDYRSMAADNTSAFNCRDVVGRPGVRSPHSSGRAWDINPWENPYRASYGWTPNSYWVNRSHPRVAWRSGAHAMVKLMRSKGFSWTYGNSDAHHFDA